MKIEIFQKKFNKIFENEVKKLVLRINKNFSKYIPRLEFVSKQIFKILTGGKKIRPYLIFSIYHIFHPIKNGNKISGIKNILVALEMFHNFCLIHDDIIDNGKIRHDTETLNYFFFKKFLKSKKDKEIINKFAESQALIIGDLIFKEVFYLLDKHNWLNSGIRFNFYKEFYKMIDLVFFGQMLDIYLTIDKSNDINLIKYKNMLKTSYYSFVEPMKLGYILAKGKNDYYFKIFEKIGTRLGLIYQIQDDILNIIGDPKKIGKDTLSDIANNQQTFLTFYLKKFLKSDYFDLRKKIIEGKINPNKLAKIIKNSNCLDFALKEIDTLSKDTISIVKSTKNIDLVNFIESLLEFIINRKK